MTESLARIDWLNQTGLLDRKILFMDLNFWIDLTKPGKENEELKELISSLVDEGKLICPVSPSLLIECLKPASAKKRNAVYDVMDEFSSGVSLRQMPDTFYEEFKSEMANLPIEPGLAFSDYRQSLMPTVMPIETFQFPPSRHSQIGVFMERDYVGASASEFQRTLAEGTEREWMHRKKATLSPGDIERHEFADTANALFPQMQEVMQGLCKDFPSDLNELKESLDQCPTFFYSYKTMSTLRVSGQALMANDVFDFLNVSGLPYVDSLACDSRIADALIRRLKLHEKYGTTIVSKKAELLAWLKGIS